MSSGFIEIKADISGAQEALSGTGKSLVSIRNRVLGIAGSYALKAVRKAVRTSGLKKRTGELQKAYIRKLNKRKGEVNLYPVSLDKTRTIFSKAQALSYGGKSKNTKWRLSGRGFVQKGWQAAESGGYKTDIDKMIQKELAKYWR